MKCAAGLRTTCVFRNQVCSKLTLMQKGVILEDDVPVASFHIFINLAICTKSAMARDGTKSCIFLKQESVESGNSLGHWWG